MDKNGVSWSYCRLVFTCFPLSSFCFLSCFHAFPVTVPVGFLSAFGSFCWSRLFPTCQVRVVRFYVSCLLLSSSPLLSSSSCSTATLDAQCSLSDLNHDHPRPVFPAGPQPRPSPPSVPCRTSTTTIHAQCSLPDLNREYPRQVFPVCRRKLERMSDKYVIYYLQTRACVVE